MAYNDYTRIVNLPKVDGSGSISLVFSPAHEYPLCFSCKHNNIFPDRCEKFGVLLHDIDETEEYCRSGYEDRERE